jgi:hypothetical protein
MHATTLEKFLPPKELADALCRDHGLCVSADYIRAIRRESCQRGERLFVAGQARPGDVFRWLESNPDFRAFTRRARPAVA